MAVSDVFEQFGEQVVYNRKDYSGVNFERCKDGSLTFKINRNGKSVYAHSKYNPVKEAERFADEMKATMESDTVFLIFGFGLGHFIRALLKKASKRNHFFIYEPDNALFTKIIDEGYCNDILENKHIYAVSDDDGESFSLFIRRFIDGDVYMRCKTVILPTYKEVYKKEFVDFLEHTKTMMSENELKRNTVFRKNELWAENSFKNTDNILNSYSIAQFQDIFKGRSAVVVSAGPSLKKNMLLLKEIKGKIPIISVFVAAKVLIANGIIPDFIVSIDNLQEGMSDLYNDIPLIYDSRVRRAFVDSHKGPNINIMSNTDSYSKAIMSKYNKETADTFGGGSVACDAVSVAEVMGCSDIILIGQDLAYTENQCHVEGTDHKAKKPDEIGYDKIQVPAIGGGMVMSDVVFKYYIQWFADYGGTKRGAVNLIDATEGGALIENTEVLTLREAINKYNSDNDDVDKIISDVMSKGTIFSEDEKEKVFYDMEEEFNELDKVLKLMEEEKELFDKYQKSLKFRSASNIKNILKIEERLDEYDEKIEKAKGKIKMLMGVAAYIEYANRYVSSVRRIKEEDEVMASAIMRKNWLIQLETALKSVKTLKKEEEKNG